MVERFRRLIPELDLEIDMWINRTKKFNGFPVGVTTHPAHRIVRKRLMELLSKKIQLEPPVKIPRKFKYFKNKKPRGLL